ncbi:MAG: hypothetical protein M5U09_00875 [Gammaproteobacteria bacterium]|nr:hypothetical protein [Gammaproteobacteria bacterium]
MRNNPKSLVCWRCGVHLADIVVPVQRTAQCPQCRTDLHVCRMCRHYDTRYTSDCAHQLADKVQDKDRVNHCSHFRVRHRAYDAGEDRVVEVSRARLESLFGGAGEPADDESAVTRAAVSRARKDDARRALDDLFGDASDKGE